MSDVNIGGTDRGRYHHGNLREALMDAALELVEERGPEGFSLREVARRAGVSPAAPYRHFDDRGALLAEVAAEGIRMLNDAMEAEAERVGPNPLERLRAQAMVFVRFAIGHPSHFRVVQIAHNWNRAVARTDSPELVLAQTIASGQEQGSLYSGDPEMISLAASSLVYGLARLIVDGHLAADKLDEAEAERLVRGVTAVFAHGLIPRQGDERGQAT